VRVLGVDDFAWKKRFRYGTLLVDLERHQIVDVLLDRDDRTFAQWLRRHPEVEVVSRDRATDYAKAAREAAPQAQQVADRFHLVRNLAEVLPMILAHCRAEIRRTEQDSLHQVEDTLHPLPTPQTWQQRTPDRVERTHQARDCQPR
jgi:transposase